MSLRESRKKIQRSIVFLSQRKEVPAESLEKELLAIEQTLKGVLRPLQNQTPADTSVKEKTSG